MFFPDFSTPIAGAAGLSIAGVALMIFAAGRLIGETMKQAPRIAREIDAAREDR